jgi:hypothetical protein
MSNFDIAISQPIWLFSAGENEKGGKNYQTSLA